MAKIKGSQSALNDFAGFDLEETEIKFNNGVCHLFYSIRTYDMDFNERIDSMDSGLRHACINLNFIAKIGFS